MFNQTARFNLPSIRCNLLYILNEWIVNPEELTEAATRKIGYTLNEESYNNKKLETEK